MQHNYNKMIYNYNIISFNSNLYIYACLYLTLDKHSLLYDGKMVHSINSSGQEVN